MLSTFSGIKNKTTKIEYNPMRMYNHSYRNTIPASTSFDNAFSDFTYSARMYAAGRGIKFYARINERMILYAVRRDISVTMSDYKED